jgi:hypothetical protein
LSDTGGLRPQKWAATEVSPQISPGGRRSVGAFFPRAPARPSLSDTGGLRPQKWAATEDSPPISSGGRCAEHHIPATSAGISCKPRIV